MYCFKSSNRAYSNWELTEIDGSSSITPDTINPLSNKWVTGDIISSDFTLVKSHIRDGCPMAGILVLSGSTYGRDLKGKLQYKCIPDNPHLPVFLTSYAAKDVGFSKKKVDRYVTFKWKEWIGKHPTCTLLENIGYVTNNEAFYEYQMRRRGLTDTYLHGKHIQKQLLPNFQEDIWGCFALSHMLKEWGLEDRTNRTIITIDPEGCRDFDDAIGWTQQNNKEVVSIYISNVPLWLEYLNLWDMVCGLPASVYLPHRTVSMLPSIFANNLCSLVAGSNRPVLSLDISIESGYITMKYSLCMINVSKNYVYDDPTLSQNSVYNSILSAAEAIRLFRPYTTEPLNSHTLIAFYMMLMNNETGNVLGKEKIGIARTHTGSSSSGLGGEVGRVVEGYHGGSARYVPCGTPTDQGHALIGDGIRHYSHITSPIRRAVDIVNMVVLHGHLGLFRHSGAALGYVHKINTGLADLNDSMSKISRVQSDCRMLQICTDDPETLNSKHSGIIIDTVCDVNNHGDINYSVYLEDLKLVYRFRVDVPLELYGKYEFTISIFRDEYSLNRKIKLSLC